MSKIPEPVVMPDYFAHRGDCDKYVENTIPAFESALERGAPAIELDVRSCMDDLVVFHDEDLLRLAREDVRLADASFEQLKEIRLGMRKQATIPTLMDVLQRFSGQLVINIEIKESGLSARVMKILKELHKSGIEWSTWIISSFHMTEIENVRLMNSEIPLALLTRKDPRKYFDFLKRTACFAVHLNLKRATNEIIAACHENNLVVGLYPIDNQQSLHQAEKLGADYTFRRSPALTNPP